MPPRSAAPALNTGRKDAKGRIIYKRASGTEFVRAIGPDGKKRQQAPSKGRSSSSRSGSAYTLTGGQNARGRAIYTSAKGRRVVKLTSPSGKHYWGAPAQTKVGHHEATAFSNLHGRAIHTGPKGALYVLDSAGKRKVPARRKGASIPMLSW